MIVKDQAGREIEIEVYGNEADDIQIDSAVYVDTGLDVSEDDIEWIESYYANTIYEEWIDNAVMRAENLRDSMEDR